MISDALELPRWMMVSAGPAVMVPVMVMLERPIRKEF
jgi:hypothetical protein